MLDTVSGIGLRIIYAILILLVGYWIANRIRPAVRHAMERREIDPLAVSFLSNIVYAAVLVIVFTAAAGKLGIETTSFIAILGAAGFAIALSLKDYLSNFAAGVLIVIFRPFRVGDLIKVSGELGRVQTTNFFSTILTSVNNRECVIPNSLVVSGVTINYSKKETLRIDLTIGISYESDLKKAKKVLQQIISADKRLLKDPEPVIAVKELGESSVDMAVRPWVATENYWDARFSLIEEIKLRFDREGIDIPYPKRHVIMERSNDNE